MASGTRSPAQRDRAIRSYVRRELYPHSPAAKRQLDAAQIPFGRVKSVEELQGVMPVSLDEVGDGSDYVVRPTRRDLMRSGSPMMRVRTAWASTWGRWETFMRHIEPSYRPVHYFHSDSVPVGAAAADLIRLAGMGAEWLRTLGVGSHDSVALVGGAGPGVEAWELSGGTRRAGVPLAVLEHLGDAARHGVTVVAGSPSSVAEALAGGVWDELRLVIVFGRSAEIVDRRLQSVGAAEQVAVRRAWAPAGVRSAWFECSGGSAYGWHTSPAAELVEASEDGELLWTGLGWAGTVFLRLRTDVVAESIDDDACGACGHHGPRLFFRGGRPALARWLANDSRVADVRVTESGADVLPVRSGANARLVSDAQKAFPGESITIKTKRGWGAS